MSRQLKISDVAYGKLKTNRDINFTQYAESIDQGWNEGTRGNNDPGAESMRGALKVPTISQIVHSVHYIYSQKTLGSNMGAVNLFFCPPPGLHLTSLRP